MFGEINGGLWVNIGAGGEEVGLLPNHANYIEPEGQEVGPDG